VLGYIGPALGIHDDQYRPPDVVIHIRARERPLLVDHVHSQPICLLMNSKPVTCARKPAELRLTKERPPFGDRQRHPEATNQARWAPAVCASSGLTPDATIVVETGSHCLSPRRSRPPLRARSALGVR